MAMGGMENPRQRRSKLQIIFKNPMFTAVSHLQNDNRVINSIDQLIITSYAD